LHGDGTPAWHTPRWGAIESTYKPDSVGGDHPSGQTIAGCLKRLPAYFGRAALEHMPGTIDRCRLRLACLAPGGVYTAEVVTYPAGALLPHRFTLTWHQCAGRFTFCCTNPAGHPGLPLTTTPLCGVRTFLDVAPTLVVSGWFTWPRSPGRLNCGI